MSEVGATKVCRSADEGHFLLVGVACCTGGHDYVRLCCVCVCVVYRYLCSVRVCAWGCVVYVCCVMAAAPF